MFVLGHCHVTGSSSTVQSTICFVLFWFFFFVTDGLSSGPAATKHPQTMTLSSPCFTGGRRSFFLKCCLVYAKHFLCSGFQIIQFYTHLSKEHYSKNLGLSLHSLWQTSVIFFLESKVFLLAHLPWKLLMHSLYIKNSMSML